MRIALLFSTIAAAVLAAVANAQTSLLDEVHTVAVPAQGVPIEHDFHVSVPGTYNVTLVDLGASLNPAAPLSSVEMAVTNGKNLVGTPLTAAGNIQFAATAAGDFIVHVTGVPGANPGSGPVGIQVTDANHVQVAAFSDLLALPSTGLPNDEGVLDDSFTVPVDGNYQITFADLQFPQALGVLTMALAPAGGSLITTLPGGANVVALQAGVTYRIFAVGQSTGALNAGLYGVNIVPAGGGSVVYAHTVPVGIVASLGRPTLTADNYTLSISDLQLPAALAQLGAVVTLKGATAAQLNAAGTQAFAATAETYDVFALGAPAGSTAGSYALSLISAGNNTALSLARAVSAPGSPTSAYTFDTTVPGGQTLAFDLADFAVPTAFTGISAVAVQAGAPLSAPLTAPGSKNTTPAAGSVSVLVFANAGASGGLFGVDLTPTAAGSAPTFIATQGVGQLFSMRDVAITADGSYQVSVADVGFPALFKNLAVIVTRGSSLIGSIFSSGTFNFPATSGHYEISFVAQPADSAGAGTYSMKVAPTPPAPTLTLQSDVTTVESGSPVKLTWTSQNATTCTASGGWTGNQPLNGSFSSVALTAATTFTLACTGDGGTVTKSVSVDIKAAAPTGGGGGALDTLTVLLLSGLAAGSGRRRVLAKGTPS